MLEVLLALFYFMLKVLFCYDRYRKWIYFHVYGICHIVNIASAPTGLVQNKMLQWSQINYVKWHDHGKGQTTRWLTTSIYNSSTKYQSNK